MGWGVSRKGRETLQTQRKLTPRGRERRKRAQVGKSQAVAQFLKRFSQAEGGSWS